MISVEKAQIDSVYFCEFDPRKSPERLEQLISCYKEVFADEPWHEWKKCPICGKKWGIDEVDELRDAGFKHCGVLVEDFWSRDSVRQDILQEITPNSSCRLAISKNHSAEMVVGFCWGYPIDARELEQKTKLPGLYSAIQKEFPGIKEVAYQDEIGLVKEMRNLKIGSAMHRQRISDFRERGMTVAVSRTKTLPPTVTYKWYIRLGYKVVAEYNDKDGRVIMVASISELDL